MELQCDISNRELGGCPMQGGQTVAFASQFMMETEVTYAQMKKEMLVILFGVDQMKQRVYGQPAKITNILQII